MNRPARSRARPDQKRDRLNVRGIALAALSVVAALLVVAALAHFLTGVSGPARPGPTETSIERPQRLLSDPLDQRAAFERDKRARLDSYGWVDRERNLAHIPIDRALQMQAADAAERTP